VTGTAGSSSTTVDWVIDTRASRLTVRAFASGMLSALGHSPTFAARDYRGEVHFDPESLKGSLVLRIKADALTVTGDLSERDRRDIERATREDVLEVAKYPEIIYECPDASARPTGEGQFEVTLPGSLTLHGVTMREPVSARVVLTGSMLRAFGEFSLQQPDYEIKPVSVGGSMLKVKDELKGAFDIVARRQPDA